MISCKDQTLLDSFFVHNFGCCDALNGVLATFKVNERLPREGFDQNLVDTTTKSQHKMEGRQEDCQGWIRALCALLAMNESDARVMHVFMQ